MKPYIALLRGVNVGGKNILPMRELVLILQGLGARDVQTYLQSGNVVLSVGPTSPEQLSFKVGSEIESRFGFRPQIVMLEVEEFAEAMAGNPFPDALSEPRSLHLGFLASSPENPDMDRLETLRRASERFQLIGRVLYLHAPEGVGRSRLAANAERLLGVALTDRNWQTVRKLKEMADRMSK